MKDVSSVKPNKISTMATCSVELRTQPDGMKLTATLNVGRVTFDTPLTHILIPKRGKRNMVMRHIINCIENIQPLCDLQTDNSKKK
jgi:hypothetical protein